MRVHACLEGTYELPGVDRFIPPLAITLVYYMAWSKKKIRLVSKPTCYYL
jgi:hypothetical protein